MSALSWTDIPAFVPSEEVSKSEIDKQYKNNKLDQDPDCAPHLLSLIKVHRVVQVYIPHHLLDFVC